MDCNEKEEIESILEIFGEELITNYRLVINTQNSPASLYNAACWRKLLIKKLK